VASRGGCRMHDVRRGGLTGFRGARPNRRSFHLFRFEKLGNRHTRLGDCRSLRFQTGPGVVNSPGVPSRQIQAVAVVERHGQETFIAHLAGAVRFAEEPGGKQADRLLGNRAAPAGLGSGMALPGSAAISRRSLSSESSERMPHCRWCRDSSTLGISTAPYPSRR
jgi:hypothetical protein